MSPTLQTGGCSPFLAPARGWALAGGQDPLAGANSPSALSLGHCRRLGQAEPRWLLSRTNVVALSLRSALTAVRSWGLSAHPTRNLRPARPEAPLQSPPPAALQHPASSPGCPQAWPCSSAPRLWFCQQAAALHPPFECNRGTAGAYSSAGRSAWATPLCSGTERCSITDVPEGRWPQLGNNPWRRSPRLRPRVGLLERGGRAAGSCRGSVPRPVSALCPGRHAVLSAAAGRSDDASRLATGHVRIYTEVSLCTQLGGGGHKHAGSNRGTTGSWGDVARLLHGSSRGARGGAGAATLLCASAAARSGDRERRINWERPWYRASVGALRRDAGSGRGVGRGAEPRCAPRPSGGQRNGLGLARLGCWWSGAGNRAFRSL